MDKLGVLKIYTARRHGELLGYISWVLQFSIESFGTLTADQGSWYVKAGIWGVGWKLMVKSLADLKTLGVKRAYPHQQAIGRSATLGRWFERIGAVPVKIVWSVDLEKGK